MATPGEPRPVTFTSGDLALEGLLHLPAASPAPALAVCHPHPLYGGDMRNNVVVALCRAAVACGVATLRFNFRGTGASEGSFDNGRGERDDLRAARDYLRGLPEVEAIRVGAAGYSFGASVALAAAGPDVAAIIAVSTPTISPLPTGLRTGCPVLLISGDRDEYSDPERLASIAEAIGPHAELEVLPGVDHFWWGSDERLAEKVSAFLRRTIAIAAAEGS